MRDDAKPWDICDDCLGPMADDLDLLIERFGKPCDLTRIDQIDAELDKILKAAALNGGTFTEQQRTCREDLISEAREIGRPPEPIDVERIFSSGNRLRMGTEWLAKTVSKKYATDLEAATREPLRQFYRLSVAASQGLKDEESTYPIHRLCGDISPNSIDFPLHIMKIQEGNASVEAGLREAAKRLRQAHAVAEAKMSQMLDSRTVRASIAEMSEPKQSARTMPIPVAVATPNDHEASAPYACVGFYKLFLAGNGTPRMVVKIEKLINTTGLTIDEKLREIDEICKIPPETTSRGIGVALMVSHAAVVQTSWWKKNRAGAKPEKMQVRNKALREKGKRVAVETKTMAGDVRERPGFGRGKNLPPE